MSVSHITVRGARHHNLKNIDVSIPRNSLTVVTGLSGSGKSSLAFDTIYAEGQRRYVETLSAYARQFLDQMERPDVDAIDGLSPAISIEQKTTSRSPRSTVGTITEIYDYLRLLWASVGKPHCPKCGHEISRQSADQIVERVVALSPGERITIYAPLVRGRKGEFREELESLDQQGFRARVDGEMVEITEGMRPEKRKNHTIEAMIDRILLKPDADGKPDTRRLEASVQKALQMAKGLVIVAIHGMDETLYSSSMACPDCGINVPKLEPRSFSFNSTYGACPECNGLGSIYDFDPGKAITDWSKPLLDGAMGPGSGSAYLLRLIKLFADKQKINLKLAFQDLPEAQQKLLLYGPPRAEAGRTGFHGIFGYLRDAMEESKSDSFREYYMQYMSATECPACSGNRLRPESLAVKVASKSIAEFTALSLQRALETARSFAFVGREKIIADRLQREVIERLEFLNAVGLSYLSLNRSAATISGGEGQRIRLATQIGSRLRGVLYVLDEPSIGLHQRDNMKLIAAMENLRDLGNTVLVVEHDEDTIRKADYVLDLGPGAGKNGGALIAAGTPDEVASVPGSLTGRYMSGELDIRSNDAPRALSGRELVVQDARSHNLRNVTARFPLGVLTVVTGVSGSGKSTLVNDILYRSLAKQLYRSREEPGAHGAILGSEQLDKVIQIDQSPIGRTPRSNPATYTGVFTAIRDLFAMLPESRERGYKPGRFSFNVQGGRCEACQGDGQRRIEMNFLPDVYVVCEVCNGRRYNQETLSVRFNGYSIADVLDLPIADALTVLADVPNIKSKLQTLVDVGLGYIHLGQSATTLSGGEAQRMKLAKELSKRQTGRTLYLLDEPTTGLHFDDVRKLLEVLQKLTDLGNSIIIIEHNLDMVRNADWIIDMGPEGGEGGGTIVAEGTPEQIAQVVASHTGSFLAKLYRDRPGSERAPAPAYVAPVVVKTEVANATKFAPSAEERAAKRKAAAKQAAAKSKAKKAAREAEQPQDKAGPLQGACRMKYESEEFDIGNYLPEVRRAEELAHREQFAAGAAPAVSAMTVVHPRQPHLGYAMLALLIGFFAVLAASLVILGLGQAMHLLPPLQQLTPNTMPGATVLSEAVGYLLTLAVIVPLFRKMWRRPFADVLHVGFETASRHAGKLMLLGVITAVLAQLIESHMTLPKEMPIDAFFRSRATVWAVAIFGTFIAPVVEELIFRGFLLRGVAIAFDWLSYPRTEAGRATWRNTDSISRTAWIFSGILTSLLFAVMHAAQLGKAWNAVAVLSLVGGVLTAVRLRLNSLAASSLVHIAYNGFIFVVLFFATDGFRHLDKMHGR